MSRYLIFAILSTTGNWASVQSICPGGLSACRCSSREFTSFTSVSCVASDPNFVQDLKTLEDQKTIVHQMYINDLDVSSLPTDVVKLKVRDLIFQDCPRLNVLNSYDNFRGFSSLEIDNANIDEVPSDLRYIPHLLYVYVGTTRINAIGADDFGNSSVKFLSVENNANLTDIEEGAFADLLNLEQLSLDENSLTYLPLNCLPAKGNRLEYLSLRGNKLHSMPAEFSERLPYLLELNINFNKFQKLPYETFIHFLRNQSTFLVLQGNSIKCNCGISWLEKGFRQNIIKKFQIDGKCGKRSFRKIKNIEIYDLKRKMFRMC